MLKDWSTFGVDLHLELDPTVGRRTALERALRDAIRAGRLAPQSRLPSTRSLADHLGLARGTITAAYDQLAAEGYLQARTGSGTVVAGLRGSASPSRPATAMQSLPRHDLRPGSPDLNLFPVAAWLRAARRALLRAPAAGYGYGDARGRIELRTALADYLGRVRGVDADPARIVITSGYVHALALLVGALGDRAAVGAGPCVAMENPGLGLHRSIVWRNGGRVVALDVDERGARTDLLSTVDFTDVTGVVVTPAHQYPLGPTLHPSRRQELTRWAQARGGVIIEDDYDGEFRYDRQPVGALQGTAAEHVAYVGTASKTLAPAVRLAWLVLPERLTDTVLELKRDLQQHTESIGQLALADLIGSHAYDRHVRSCRQKYRRRRDLLVSGCAQLSRELPMSRELPVHGVAAGLHAVVGLPEGGPSEQQILEAAASQGVALTGLAGHWHTHGDHPQGIIVGYATPSEAAYPAALAAFGHVLRTTFARSVPST